MAAQRARGGAEHPGEQAASPADDRRTAERGRELAQRIVSHSLRVGLGPDGKLPTERQLARDLDVTRSSVRYALAILQAQGRLSREVGRGTYLRTAPGSTDTLPGRSTAGAGVSEAIFAPADVMMVRRLLEPPAMPLAVAWATATDFAEMDRCLAGGDRAVSYEEFETWDLALHRSIIAATHSPLLVTLYSSIELARHGHVWGDLKRRSASAARRTEYQADHHRVVAALKARDAATAITAMRNHLARVSGHLNATDPAAGIWP
ncbi:MAG: FCD domain-containing protein [Nocardiopsaceae bacterium]|jgi:DNA-binding FadR family transcriptional regulator|nr:FCD domain-containing protein [Nocardiopsaceae bacterium]